MTHFSPVRLPAPGSGSSCMLAVCKKSTSNRGVRGQSALDVCLASQLHFTALLNPSPKTGVGKSKHTHTVKKGKT